MPKEVDLGDGVMEVQPAEEAAADRAEEPRVEPVPGGELFSLGLSPVKYIPNQVHDAGMIPCLRLGCGFQ